MSKLILASGSPQRKKLLRDLGVPFTVKVSRAKEVERIQTTCAALVKANARIKAASVARTLRSGIVIGADTLVYGGNKTIIGKPKNLRDARRILKTLFSKPHWVYTGVSVIDCATRKTLTDYEKTKVYMVPLSDKEIARYHRKVSPLDKSGGFDIEGKGSVFIHRVEGCYTNVIGLPIAKLAGMLKKFGVSIL